MDSIEVYYTNIIHSTSIVGFNKQKAVNTFLYHIPIYQQLKILQIV